MHLTSDEYPAYGAALRNAYSEKVATKDNRRPVLNMVTEKVDPERMNDAGLEKRWEKGRGVEIEIRVVSVKTATIQAVLAQASEDAGDCGGTGRSPLDKA